MRCGSSGVRDCFNPDIDALMNPAISIVMPCYNAAAHLPLSVGSVLAQTRDDWELIIVDDGSKDLSWQTLQRLAAQDPRIRIFQQPNAGPAAARNRALREARGARIAFLDSDDTWHPEFLDAMAATLDADPGAGIAYCGWQNIGLGEARDKPFIPPEYENSDKIGALLGGCRWPIHGALVRSQIIKDAGSFDETLSSCMDYDLWLRLGALHRLVRVPRVLAYYHHHGGEQITRNRARIAINHWRAQQKFLQANPAVLAMLDARRISELTSGELLQRGYASYWKRDLPAARQIFRVVMKQGYGTLRDWKYMLPAWLPESWHRWLIGQRDREEHKTDGQS
jgi:glycosyltransferase involved in cell wall biosynthesis